MSEDDIKGLDLDGLKDLIIECSLKDTALKEKKRLLVKSLNEIIKRNEGQLGLAKEILEARDSELARKIIRELSQN
jgi:hypothetical protein